MKTKILLLSLLFAFLTVNVFSQTVYITNTGTKYHKEGCRYLSKSKISIDLKDAISKGYGACSVCKPPTNATTTTTTTNTQTNTVKTEPTKVNTSTTTTTKSKTVQCSATTKAGTRCKRMTTSSNGKCWQHGGN